MNIVMTGPPGSGKGTQGKLLSRNLNIPHISIGSLLRKLSNENSDLGRKINSIIDTGKLVPTEVVIDQVTRRITSIDCKKGFILDGVRRVEEAIPLNEGINFDHFIHINITEKESHIRLGSRMNCPSCGDVYGPAKTPLREGYCDSCNQLLYQRDDDTYEVIQQRIDVFNKQGQPILDYAESLGLLNVVNGNQKINDVLSDIKKMLITG